MALLVHSRVLNCGQDMPHPLFSDAPYRPKKQIKWPAAILCCLLVLCGVGVSQFSHAMPSSSLPHSVARSDVSSDVVRYAENSGQLVFKNTGSQNGTKKLSALHLGTHIESAINGVVAQVTYIQTFTNSTDNFQEGIYTFPLPENAAVNDMEIHIGERIIKGMIKEKKEAKRVYETAKRQGKRAALTEQQRPNLFTQKIANIEPNQTVKVILTFIQPVEYKNSYFEWRLPTTLTPRFIPGESLKSESEGFDEAETEKVNHLGWAQPTADVQDAHKITPPMISTHSANSAHNQFSLNVALNSGLPLANIDALYHEIAIQKKASTHQISLAQGKNAMDRDFILQWRPIVSKAPQAAFFNEIIDGDNYGLLIVMPPQGMQPKPDFNITLPRDIIFIIDTSGSMQGDSIIQAKNSLQFALERLKPEDRFNVIEFNSQVKALFNDFEEVNPQSLAYGKQWVNHLKANGGTNMLPALEAAFNHSNDADRLQQIVFMTDGAVGNEQALFKMIHNDLNQAKLFTVGIGSAPNTYFMRKAAEFGRGSFTYIAQPNEVANKMGQLFSQLESAHSRKLHIEWNTHAEQYPQKIGDLYLGEPLIVPVKLDNMPAEVTVSGENQAGAWQQIIDLTALNTQATNSQHRSHSGIGTLWARSKIMSIEDEGVTGDKTQEEVKSAVITEAFKHKLLTRFTSFVAVEEKAIRPLTKKLQSGAIPNALPKNSMSKSAVKQIESAQSAPLSAIQYPQTATWAGLTGWLGAFFFLCFLFLFAIRHEP